jgi:hypothetical protein
MRGSRGSAVPRPSRQHTGGMKDESHIGFKESHAHEGSEHASGHSESNNGHHDQAKPPSRKRQRDASPEDKGPRRQKDDAAPKNKIRRPEVAAAYRYLILIPLRLTVLTIL